MSAEQEQPEITEWGFTGNIVTETTSMTGKVMVNGMTVKKFQGETAWMDAERYAYDLQIKEEMR